VSGQTTLVSKFYKREDEYNVRKFPHAQS
jgi:hypothetical protein